MSNIFRGSATEDEIKSFIGGRPLVPIYAKDKDIPNADGDYPFWSNIRHPETGNTLYAIKGYCEPSKHTSLEERLCYYAEYKDDSGSPYYYLDSRYFCKPELRGTKSISEQQYEDNLELKQKMACADENFLSKYRSIGEPLSMPDEDFFTNNESGNGKYSLQPESVPQNNITHRTDLENKIT